MIVVADTSPLNYLILIEEIDVLRKLYGRILIPPAVRNELLQPGTPSSVIEWMRNPPSWLEVQSPVATTIEFSVPLDPGETAAIALAEELQAHQIILDEDLGRQEAIRRGLSVIGTIGICEMLIGKAIWTSERHSLASRRPTATSPHSF